MKGYIQAYLVPEDIHAPVVLGITLRAVGAGLKIFIARLIFSSATKDQYIRTNFLNSVTIENFGPFIIKTSPFDQDDRTRAQNSIHRLIEIFNLKSYDIVIFENCTTAVYYGIIQEGQLIHLMDSKPDTIELVLTGMHMSHAIIERSDLYTEMRRLI